MTNERKIEILEKSKEVLNTHYKTYGICVAFYHLLKDDEFLPAFINECEYYLGDVLLKHKPEKTKEDGLWMDTTKKNLKIRIAIVDEMILELKSQIRP